ncbi:MAG: DUF1996 domain-containing protein [Pseudomonadota bacterium]
MMKGFFFNRSGANARPVSSQRRWSSALPLVALTVACGGGGDADAGNLAGGGSPSSTSTSTSPSASNVSGPVAGTSGLLADVASFPKGAVGATSERVSATAERPSASDGTGNFRTTCEYSHMAYDDPIVFPGQPGRSHLHAFFGNTAVTAHSTSESIAQRGNSTCRGGTVNRSAYWVPAMIDTRSRTPVQPQESMFYYKTGYNGVRPADVRPFPAGLRMIAGDPSNRNPSGHFRYYCYNNPSMRGNSFPNCPVGDDLVTEIWFPQCWDGVNLDSPDHKSHMAYPRGGCPASHPVPLPEITFNIHYRVTQANQTAHWRMSSDTYDGPPGYSSHGDWWNGWEQTALEEWVRHCNNPGLDCHAHLLGNGRQIF